MEVANSDLNLRVGLCCLLRPADLDVASVVARGASGTAAGASSESVKTSERP